MARRWSGFIPQNLTAKEEWALLEACEAQTRVVRDFRSIPESQEAAAEQERRPPQIPKARPR